MQNKHLGYLGIDQCNQKFFLKTKNPRKELLEMLGRTKAEKMFVDDKDGNRKHIGYIIAGHWITLYNVTEWSGQNAQ
jgi:hypothetical protein